MPLIKHADIRNKLVSGLHKFMNLLVVQQSSIGDQPLYPFMTYAITSPYIQLGQPEHYTIIRDGNVLDVSKEHYEQVYSFTVASQDEDEAMNICLQAIQFFKFFGRQNLADANIAVVKISNISARDNMITIDYERRYGFDVKIRVACEEITETTGVIDYVSFGSSQIETPEEPETPEEIPASAFLLNNGEPFLFSDGTCFACQGRVEGIPENAFLLANGEAFKLSDGTPLLYANT